MRLVSIDEAWEQYSGWFTRPFEPPSSGIFVMREDELVAGCSIGSLAEMRVMFVTRVNYKDEAAGKFLFRVLRGHESVTGCHAVVYMSDGSNLGMPLEGAGLFVLTKEIPQARGGSDPGDVSYDQQDESGVPDEKPESKPRARKKRSKK